MTSRLIFGQKNLAEICFSVSLSPSVLDGIDCQKQPYDESSEQKVEVNLLRCH